MGAQGLLGWELMSADTPRRAFSRGFRAAIDGLKTAFSNAEARAAYLRATAGLFVLAVVFTGAGIGALFTTTVPGSDAAVWVVIVLWIARVSGTLLALVIGPLVALFAVNIVFPSLNQDLFMAGLRAVDPGRAERITQGPGMSARASAWGATRRLFRFAWMSAGFLLLNLVPVVGSVAGIAGQGWLNARSLAWELMDPYFDCLDISYQGQLDFVERHRHALLGFGLPLSLMFAIPFLGPLLVGLGQGAVGTFIVREIADPTMPTVAAMPALEPADPPMMSMPAPESADAPMIPISAPEPVEAPTSAQV